MAERLVNNLLALPKDYKLPTFSIHEELGEKAPPILTNTQTQLAPSFADKKEFRSFAQGLIEKYLPSLNEGNAYLLEAFVLHAEKAAESLLLSVEKDNAELNEQLEIIKNQGRLATDEQEKKTLRAKYESIARRRKGFATAPIETVLQQVLLDEIFIDGLAYSLIGRNNKIVLHENIYELLAKVSAKYNVRIRAIPIHAKAIEVANEKDIPLAEIVLNPQNYPPKLSWFDFIELDDVAGIMVIVAFLSGNAKDEVTVYPASFLLDMAKRIIQGGKIHSFYTKDGRVVVQKFPLSGPWNDGRSNYIEMLKKTALRNILKIFR